MSWTDDRVETLRKLWGSGKSASDIAKILGGITRNAVIGKAHRLGLSGKSKPARRPQPQPAAQPKPGRPAVAVVASSEEAQAPSVPAPAEVARPPVAATILDLTERMCKWPIGDPKDADFHFCGRPSKVGAPYCAEHAAKAYQPPQSRKAREEERERRAHAS